MIIIGIIALFRKQGEINVSRTVLPAPAAPVMSCKGWRGGGGGGVFHPPSSAVFLTAFGPQHQWLLGVSHPPTASVRKVEAVATHWLWRTDAWKPWGMSLDPHLVSLQPAGTQMSPPLSSGCAEAFPEVSAWSLDGCYALPLLAWPHVSKCLASH